MWIYIKTNERAILLVNGLPKRWLEPGRHWKIAWSGKVEVKRLDTDALIANIRPEHAALAPAEELERVLIEGEQRAIVWQRGKPVRWLGVGLWHVWRVDPTVRVERVDVSQIATKPLASELATIVSPSDYVEQMVPTGHVAQRYVDGALDAIVKPGRHAAWTVTHKVTYALVDLREKILQVSGQDVMTRDRVTLRLNVAAAYRVADPERLAAVARDPDDVLYVAVQMAIRQAVTSRTLDELLAARDAVASELEAAVSVRAEAVGLQVRSVGLKDMVLPGDMKVLLNRVIEARKQAEANVILRREEAAATRALAQTAKLLEDAPVLQKLKELESLEKLAAQVGDIHLVVGSDGLDKLKLVRD